MQVELFKNLVATVKNSDYRRNQSGDIYVSNKYKNHQAILTYITILQRETILLYYPNFINFVLVNTITNH